MESKKKNFAERWQAFTAWLFRFDIEPRRQWESLILKTLALAVILAALHAYLFYGIRDRKVFAPAVPAQAAVPALDGGKLAIVLDRFNAKATVRTNASSIAPSVADPSK